MKTRQTSNQYNLPVKNKTGQVAKQNAPGFFLLFIFALMALCATANAQTTAAAMRFQFVQDRVTVPMNSSNTTTITNFVILVNGASNANFTVSGLPASATAVLTDTNGNPMTYTTIDTNLWLTLNTTNVPEGIYNFQVNVAGVDTNGVAYSETVPYVLQSAYIWNGTLNNTNSWSSPLSWLGGGVPSNTDDVIFTDIGGQSNNFAGTTGIPFTNSFVDTNFTINSLRFAQTGVTNAIATNPPPAYHHLHIATGKTLTVTGTNGLSLMRDDFDDGSALLGTMGVFISGDAGAKLVLTNTSANDTIFVGGSLVPTLNMSNLLSLSITASRIGLGDYELYPNYFGINTALNEGRNTNTYSARPRQMSGNIYLAQTNLIIASYKDPNNYTNENTRGYPFTLYNNEQGGVGSSSSQLFLMGITNRFDMDAICFYGASGNGTAEFGVSNGWAVFRNADGVSAMTDFTVSDDGGTNEAASNMKGNVDFSFNNGIVDILANQLFVARDRVQIATNQTPNIQGTLTIGRTATNNESVNTVFLGYQEHTKPDWTLIGGGQPYLNYCQGKLIVTNGGSFKINGTMTLGYTADTNAEADAEQYNTYGQLTIYSNSTVSVSNIVVDGGLNFYDPAQPRANNISINTGANLIITNALGGNNYTGSSYPTFANQGSPCLPLDNLTMSSGSTLTLFVAVGKTNAYVRNFTSTGTTPGTIKVAALSGVSTFPVTIPLIAYSAATPFVQADISAITNAYPGVQGYILNDTVGQTINLFLTTTPPDTLVWRGQVNGNWDLSTPNWVTASGGIQTNFNDGDIVTFDDTSTATNVVITTVVVPNQATNGVTINNTNNFYTFSSGGSGAIAGTAKILKQGTNEVVFEVSESGPINITAGRVDVDASGALGNTTLSSNTVLNINGSGIVNGLTSTSSAIDIASQGTLNGLIFVSGGSLVNNGTINAPTGSEMIQTNGCMFTNTINGLMNLGGSNPQFEEYAGCTFANFGVIAITAGRLYIDSLFFGNGTMYDPVDPVTSSSLARYEDRDLSSVIVSPGATPSGSIGNMYLGVRVDLSTDNNPGVTAPNLLIEVDTTTPNDYDYLTCAKWNDIGCLWDITNVNGTFQSGQSFTILQNAAGAGSTNMVDTATIFPLIQPTLPGPGLEWNLTGIQPFGTVGVTNCSMIWTGIGDSTWNTNGSVNDWKSGAVYGDAQGAVFDDTATGSTTVTINSPVAPDGINIVITTNIIGSVTNVVFTTNTPPFMPGIIVSNSIQNYTFVGTNRITGITGVYKAGTGTLTMLTTNDFTGGVFLNGGTFAMTNIAAFGKAPAQSLAYNQIMIDNATMKYFATNNVALGRFMTINHDGATFEVSSNGTEFTLNQTIVGTGGMTKTGPGTLVLSSSADTYAGGTTISQGILRLTVAAAPGTGALTLSNSTTLQLTNSAVSSSVTFSNVVNVPGTGTGLTIQGVSTNIWGAAWNGTGSVTFATTNANDLFVFNESLAGFGGAISFGASSNAFRFNNKTNLNDCTGSATASFNLGTGAATLYNYNGAGLTYNLGALSGGANTILSGSITNSGVPASTYSIGANGASTSFAGKITDGSAGSVTVTKVGTGTLLLDGASTYSGGTTVSAGTLGGVGSISGNLVVQSSGTLDPGDTIGTFTVGGTATLGGTVQMEINQTSVATNDMLVVSGAITASGVLNVSNTGPSIINGSVFQLFNKPVTGLTVNLPATDPTGTTNYTWLNSISSNGSIQLTAGGIVPNTINPNPTNIVFSVTGNSLTLGWPSDHTGWTLQAQTNPLINGISNNWFNVAGSTSTNVYNAIMDPNNGSVFYRLFYQP